MSAPFKEFSVWRTGSYPAKFSIRVTPDVDSAASTKAQDVSRFIRDAIKEKMEREK
jgi:hypothetical protein